MRFFVAGAIYRASGALFSTIDTVAGEKPLDFATSRIVMVWFFPLCLFNKSGVSDFIIILPELPDMQWARGPVLIPPAIQKRAAPGTRASSIHRRQSPPPSRWLR